MLVLRKDLGRTQVAALRYSLCLFLRTKGSQTHRTTMDLPLTHRIEKQLGKKKDNTSLYSKMHYELIMPSVHSAV